MVISDEHRYLFVEVPNTGSTAVAQELCCNYAGRSILHKHAHYPEFRRQAGAAQMNYFVFSTVRHPLDTVVSIYFRYKTNKQGCYTDPTQRVENRGFVTQRMRSKFAFVNSRAGTFPRFVRRYYRLPYDSWTSLSHQSFDYVMRFEALQSDFSQVLSVLGLSQVRELPLVNRTKGRMREFGPYYPPDLRRRVQWVFGPYMRQWGYSFPSDWPEAKPSPGSGTMFRLLAIFRRVYWGSVKWRIRRFRRS